MSLSTMSLPTLPTAAIPPFNGGGIEFLTWSSKIQDFAHQNGLLTYLLENVHATAVANDNGDAIAVPFVLLVKPVIPDGARPDFNLYKARFAEWQDQDNKIVALRAC